MQDKQKRLRLSSFPYLVAFGLLLTSGCATPGAGSGLEKQLAVVPQEVIVAAVRNETGRELTVRSGLISRLLSTTSQSSATIPELMGEALRKELSSLGVSVSSPGGSAQGDGLPVLSASIEKWEEASTRAYGRVIFLSAVYRLRDPRSNKVLWQVRQAHLPLPVEKVALDRPQAERAIARAVKKALQHWPAR